MLPAYFEINEIWGHYLRQVNASVSSLIVMTMCIYIYTSVMKRFECYQAVIKPTLLILVKCYNSFYVYMTWQYYWSLLD